MFVPPFEDRFDPIRFYAGGSNDVRGWDFEGVSFAYNPGETILHDVDFELQPGKIIAGFSGLVVDTFGYINFFLSVSVLGLPAIFLVLYLMRRANPDRALAAPATGG